MEKKRNGEIDFLRFVFSVIIVAAHFTGIYKMGLFVNGGIGVEFFFVVSGFLMAKYVDKKNKKHNDLNYISNETWHYLINKVKPLYRYYIVAFLCQIIVRNVLINHEAFTKIIKGLLGSIPTLTLTYMVLNENAVYLPVGPIWFLSAMLIAILILYPMLLRNYQFSVKILFPIIVLFFLGYLNGSYHSIRKIWDWTGITYTGVLRAIAEIALGSCLYYLSSLIIEKKWWAVKTGKKSLRFLLTCAKVCCYGVVLLFAQGKVFGKAFNANFNLHALLFCSIGVLLSFSSIGYSIPDSKVTRFLGKLSLPIYIFHDVIRRACYDYTGQIEISARIYALFIIMAITISIVMMYLTDFIFARLKPLAKKFVE